VRQPPVVRDGFLLKPPGHGCAQVTADRDEAACVQHRRGPGIFDDAVTVSLPHGPGGDQGDVAPRAQGGLSAPTSDSRR
jgi:hypothetical protein